MLIYVMHVLCLSNNVHPEKVHVVFQCGIYGTRSKIRMTCGIFSSKETIQAYTKTMASMCSMSCSILHENSNELEHGDLYRPFPGRLGRC